MPIDRDKALRHPIPPVPVEIERGQLRLFARATGQRNPLYVDLDAARAAGHRDLPVPLTFLGNSLELSLPHPLDWLEAIGGDERLTTHAGQEFISHATAYAGDSLLLHRKVVDVYTRRNGALEFVVKKTDVMRGDELVVEAFFIAALQHRTAQA